MAAKPLTTEAVALTEKKMDMSLDDIIRMSKTNDAKPIMKHRVSNRNQNFAKNTYQDKYAKVQRFNDTRSSVRQGSFAQRRSNFKGNQFALATEAARKAGAVSIHNKVFNQSRTFNVTKPRFGAKPFQKNAENGGGFVVKKPLQKVNAVSWQKPQTLDSRFANMKEQRMRVVFSSQSQSQSQFQYQPSNNNGAGQRRFGNGVGRPRGVPWARNRFPISY